MPYQINVSFNRVNLLCHPAASGNAVIILVKTFSVCASLTLLEHLPVKFHTHAVSPRHSGNALAECVAKDLSTSVYLEKHLYLLPDKKDLCILSFYCQLNQSTAFATSWKLWNYSD